LLAAIWRSASSPRRNEKASPGERGLYLGRGTSALPVIQTWIKRRDRFAVPLGLVRTQKRRDFAVKLPKLYVVAVNELPGLLFGVLVVFAEKFDGSENVAVMAHDVRAIVLHAQFPKITREFELLHGHRD
jgi:hypothetical protein